MTVIDVPVDPFTGVKLIFVTTLKLAIAEFELLSVAVTTLVPPGTSGTLKLVPKFPDASVVAVATWPDDPNVILTDEDAAKPVPLTVTDVLVGPLTGVRAMFETTLKFFDEAVIPSDTVIEWEPAIAGGIVTDWENPPVEFDVTVVKVEESN